MVIRSKKAKGGAKEKPGAKARRSATVSTGATLNREEFLKRMHGRQGGAQLICPYENDLKKAEINAKGKSRSFIWWEVCEIIGTTLGPDPKAKEAEFPLSERVITTVKFQIASDSDWYDENGGAFGESENQGKKYTGFYREQPLSEDDGGNMMTDMAQTTKANIVSAFLGFDEDNIDDLPWDEEGNLDIDSFFDSGEDEEGHAFEGKWALCLFGKKKDSGSNSGTNVELLRCAPLDSFEEAEGEEEDEDENLD